MSTAAPQVNDTVKNHESITTPDILSHATPLFWTTSLLRASSQILTLTVAVAAARAGVKGSRVSMTFGAAGIAATALYKRRHKTPPISKAFLKEFGITLEGPRLKLTDFTKTQKDEGFPVIASVDGVRGIYMLHEVDGRITVTDPDGVKLQRISRR